MGNDLSLKTILMANPSGFGFINFWTELPWYLRSAKHLENCCTDLDISLGGVDPWKDQPVEVQGMSWCYICTYISGTQTPNGKQHEHALETSRNHNHTESPIKSNNCRKSVWFLDAYSSLSIRSWQQKCGLLLPGFQFLISWQTMMLSRICFGNPTCSALAFSTAPYTKGLMHMTRRTTPRSLFLVVVATWSHRKEGPVVILESHEREWNLMEQVTSSDYEENGRAIWNVFRGDRFPVPFRWS